MDSRFFSHVVQRKEIYRQLGPHEQWEAGWHMFGLSHPVVPLFFKGHGLSVKRPPHFSREQQAKPGKGESQQIIMGAAQPSYFITCFWVHHFYADRF